MVVVMLVPMMEYGYDGVSDNAECYSGSEA